MHETPFYVSIYKEPNDMHRQKIYFDIVWTLFYQINILKAMLPYNV